MGIANLSYKKNLDTGDKMLVSMSVIDNDAMVHIQIEGKIIFEGSIRTLKAMAARSEDNGFAKEVYMELLDINESFDALLTKG